MSLARNMAAVGQAATAAFEEEDVTNLRTRQAWRAKISPIADTTLNTELGLDARATDIFYFPDPAACAGIKAGDELEALGCKFVVLPSNDPQNPASLHLEFHCQRVVEGVDS